MVATAPVTTSRFKEREKGRNSSNNLSLIRKTMPFSKTFASLRGEMSWILTLAHILALY
jgi:hypothetical protein